MSRRVPEGPPPPPTVQRIRLQYAKRGRLRFTSHRDFARAFERALRRAEIPMAYSAGFSPHPKISYVGAAPTGVASEGEYLEIGLSRRMDIEAVRAALDEVLPDGLDIIDVVEAVIGASGSLPERMQAGHWQVELTGVGVGELAHALAAFMDQEQVLVSRLTKDGRREIDARGAVVWARATPIPPAVAVDEQERAILEMVVRLATPAVRPDDVLAALASVAGLAPSAPPRAVRLAQGPLDDSGRVGDPFAADRVTDIESKAGTSTTDVT
jgi:radical SAM-linked protein